MVLKCLLACCPQRFHTQLPYHSKRRGHIPFAKPKKSATELATSSLRAFRTKIEVRSHGGRSGARHMQLFTSTSQRTPTPRTFPSTENRSRPAGIPFQNVATLLPKFLLHFHCFKAGSDPPTTCPVVGTYPLTLPSCVEATSMRWEGMSFGAAGFDAIFG